MFAAIHRYMLCRLICLLVLPVAHAHAQDGLVLQILTKDHSEVEIKVERSEILAANRNLRIEVEEGGDRPTSMIYHRNAEQILVLDHNDRSYIRIDKAAATRLGGQIGSAMAQMQEAMQNLPPEQRAMMENMMREQMPQASLPGSTSLATQIKATNKLANKAGYPCRQYEVYRDGNKIRELWVTDWRNISGGENLIDSFEGMSELIQTMTDALGALADSGTNPFADLKELDGFPVVMLEYDSDGALISESTLSSVSEQPVDASEFEPPAGYREQSPFGQ